MEKVIAVGIILVIAFVIWAVYQASEENVKIQSLEQQLQELPDFDATDHYIYLADSPGIAMDKERRKFATLNGETIKVYEATAMLSCELLQDNVQLLSTKRGGQLAGAAAGWFLAGGVGALIGGLSGKQKSVKGIKEVALRILIDDFDAPSHTISFFNSYDEEGVSSSNSEYREALQQAELWHGRATMLMKGQA